MNTSQAVKEVLKLHGLTKYRLAQSLGCAPISIDQWLRHTKMSEAYREIFFKLYGVEIDDSV